MMNVSNVASELSFMIIQQPTLIATILIIALAQFVFPLLNPDGQGQGKIFANPLITLMQIFLLQSIIFSSLLTSNASKGSVLISTQIGTLVQFMILVFFYLCLGRFPIDIFHTRDRDTKNDWIYYLSLMIGFILLYTIVAIIRFLK